MISYRAIRHEIEPDRSAPGKSEYSLLQMF